MLKYFVNRTLGMLAVLAVVVTIVFFIGRMAPGDPAAVMLGPDATADEIQELRVKWGLDRSMPLQYAAFIVNLMEGNLGESIFLGKPVVDALLDRAEPTVFLTLFATLLATAIALPVGILAAYRHGSRFDQAATTLAMLASSIPSFWLGLLLIQVVAVRFGWLPVSGYGGPDATFADRLSHLVLPAVAIGFAASALIVRFTRASMLDVLADDYVRTARSKGMGEFRVVMRHALRNAFIPVLTIIGLIFAGLMSGAVVTETVFGLPGLGTLVVQAVARRDYPVIQGTLLVVAAIYVLINFSIDMLYMLIDPRVKY